MKNKAASNDYVGAKPKTTASSKDEDVDDEIDIKITDYGFRKYFVKGISSLGLKRQIRSAKLTTLEEVYSFISDIYDSDDEDEINNVSEEKSKKENVETKVENKSTVDNDGGVSELIAGIKNMTLITMGEVVSKVNNMEQQPKPAKKPTC